MPRIKLLTPLVSNQIAAGEVVERPAAVMKELLENSLDAHAKHIHIDVEKGGMRLLRVSDDGCGIHKEDLTLALSRHATSKIESLRDLQHIASLGFRGEALASMSAVSRMTLQSCAQEAQAAWKIQMAGDGNVEGPMPCAHPAGTTIEVEDLFFNTPARRQFLRSEKTEFTHVEEIFKRIALSRFDVSFIFRHNQREQYHLRAVDKNSSSQRIAAICGNVFLQQSLQLESHAAGLVLEGWLGLPDGARSQNDLQYFYINGRVIKDRLITHAINQAYQDKLHPGRHPCYVLFLTIDPQTVDVNVHPTKQEVRFRESRLIHDFIFRHLHDALTSDKKTIPIETPSVYSSHATHHFSHYGHHPVQSVREKMQAYSVLHQAGNGAPVSEMGESAVKDFVSHEGKIIGCLHQTYILVEKNSELQIINMARACARIMYGQLLKAEQQQDFQPMPLLIPSIVTLPSEWPASLLESLFKKLSEWGIVIDQTSPHTVVIRQLPQCLQQISLEAWLIDMMNDWLKTSTVTLTSLALVSVRHFHFIPKAMSLVEMRQLLDALFLMEERYSLKLAPVAIKTIEANQWDA